MHAIRSSSISTLSWKISIKIDSAPAPLRSNTKQLFKLSFQAGAVSPDSFAFVVFVSRLGRRVTFT
jgi:hypothetical protein